MKKIIPLILVLLLFSGCKAKEYTPVIKAEFKACAVYKTGDFSYTCEIIRTGDTFSISPTSTRAKGLVISCNGKEVSFKRNDFIKTFSVDELDKTNPAIMLYRVFTSLESADVKLIDGYFTYTGNSELGKYILKQDKNNAFVSLSIPQADINIDFKAFM